MPHNYPYSMPPLNSIRIFELCGNLDLTRILHLCFEIKCKWVIIFEISNNAIKQSELNIFREGREQRKKQKKKGKKTQETQESLRVRDKCQMKQWQKHCHCHPLTPLLCARTSLV